MSTLDLSRWQFALTTLFHFLFVPLTIGLSWLVAVMQTAWRRTGNDEWMRLTRFFGKLLLINVAIGVATGLVQEFQFGMNWSAYSRFVGDVFGAPLAIEGLAAFFLESTFLGAWVFGWGKLSARVHLATIYLAAVGATLSALFILAANSWMQHPVGYIIDKATGRPQLTDIGALFTNKVFIWATFHTLLAAFVIAGTLLVAVSCWHLRRGREVEAFRRSAAMGLIVLFPAVGLALMTGGRLAVTITQVQPMKTAAMESLWQTESPAAFSLVQIGGMEPGSEPVFDIEVPHLLSLLATGSWDGEVQGIDPLQQQSEQQYGDGWYVPTIQFSYWSLRTMAYLGVVLLLFSGFGLVLLKRGSLERAHRFQRLATWSIVLPVLINLAGWILAETGRQPWVVWGLQTTADGVSPSISAAQVWTSILGFGALYIVLGAIEIRLMRRFARGDLDPPLRDSNDDPDSTDDDPRLTALSY
ncbi:MAG: cytochrome ubiquinol oxidase subunit I [Microthrixaceae bacterium]